ncbi:MAG: hypothetical protein AAF266_04500, partial [Planctomycetota bacterium]
MVLRFAQPCCRVAVATVCLAVFTTIANGQASPFATFLEGAQRVLGSGPSLQLAEPLPSPEKATPQFHLPIAVDTSD